MKFELLIIILLTVTVNAHAQNLAYEPDKNYRDDVKTVLLYPTGFPLDKPIIPINEMYEALHLEFDIMSSEAPYLYFTYIHCDNNWQPSNIEKHEYINGFFQDELQTFEFSRNTTIDYVHYDMLLPNQNMMPLISGNYILVVRGDDPEDIYFTRRFFIMENMATIAVEQPRYPWDLSLGTNKQELDLEITYPNLFNNHANEYCNVTLMQNGRWDNAVIGLKPTYTYPEKLSYINNNQLVFEGGNQYMRINTSNLYNRPEKTKSVYREGDYNVVTLYHDTKRNTVAYLDEEDIHGERSIYLERTDLNTTTEAEYTMVEFFLDLPNMTSEYDIYILGAINDWKLDENSLMKYDSEMKCYKNTMILKQGYYDYMYVVKDKVDGKTSLEPINGCFWETNNVYHIFVYLREPTLNYDRLIGYTSVSSH